MLPFPRNQFREFAHHPVPGCHSHSSLNSSFNEAKLSEPKGRKDGKQGWTKKGRGEEGEEGGGGDVTRGCPVGLGRATRPPPRHGTANSSWSATGIHQQLLHPWPSCRKKQGSQKGRPASWRSLVDQYTPPRTRTDGHACAPCGPP